MDARLLWPHSRPGAVRGDGISERLYGWMQRSPYDATGGRSLTAMRCYEFLGNPLPIGRKARGCSVRTADEPSGVTITLTCRHGCQLRHFARIGGEEFDWALTAAWINR